MEHYIHVLVLSDTHGNKSAIDSVLRQNPQADYIFHLGDCIADARYIDEKSRTKIICVKGNCDFGDAGSNENEIVLQGNRILLTHGHRYHVKYSYDRLFYRAQEREAKAVLFGHTHKPYCAFDEGIWMVNPGSAGESWDGNIHYATLVIGKMGIIPKLRTLCGE